MISILETRLKNSSPSYYANYTSSKTNLWEDCCAGEIRGEQANVDIIYSCNNGDSTCTRSQSSTLYTRTSEFDIEGKDLADTKID